MRSASCRPDSLLLPSPPARPAAGFLMDPGWRFTLGDPAGAERPGFDAKGWRLLDLPHDWSIEGTPGEDAPGGGRVGLLPSGIGWYRKSFRLPAGARGQSVAARVRRDLHERRGVAQRDPAGEAPVRLHRRRLRCDEAPGRGDQCDRGPGRQLGAAEFALVHRQRHLPPRLAHDHGSPPRGALGDVGHHSAGGLRGRGGRRPHPAGERPHDAAPRSPALRRHRSG